MFKGLGDLAGLVRQAQQVSSKMQAVNESLKSQRVTGTAGGGMIEVEANGLGEILRVKIEPGLVERQEREMIEDLLPGAVNQAVAKSKQLYAEAMKSAASGLDIPGLGEALAQLTSPDRSP